MQYVIESRELTSEYTDRPTHDVERRRTTIEAADVDDAIKRFIHDSRSELVSLVKPSRGLESIVTVKRDDSVYLLRVYAA